MLILLYSECRAAVTWEIPGFEPECIYLFVLLLFLILFDFLFQNNQLKDTWYFLLRIWLKCGIKKK